MKVRKAPKEAIKVSEVTASYYVMSCKSTEYWGCYGWSFFHHDHETLMRCHFPFHCSRPAETLWSKAQITLRIRLMTQRFTFQALIPLVKTWPTFHFIWLYIFLNDIFIIRIFTNFHRICHLYCSKSCAVLLEYKRDARKESLTGWCQTVFKFFIWKRLRDESFVFEFTLPWPSQLLLTLPNYNFRHPVNRVDVGKRALLMMTTCVHVCSVTPGQIYRDQ